MTAAAVMLVALTGAARAQDDSLKIIPGKSPIVVQVNGIEKARANLAKFLGNALPDIAPKLVKKVDDAISELAKDRDLKSISKDGRIYLVVTDLENITESPQIAVLVPASNYKSFKEGFLKEAERKSLKDEGEGIDSAKFEDKEEPIYLTYRKDYVVITPDKEVAKTFVKHDVTKGLDSKLSKETAKSFLGQDIAVYIDLKEINKQYGAQIRLMKGFIEPLLQGGGMGLDKKQIEAAKHVIDGMISLFDDGAAAVLGFEFRPEGANVHFLAQFKADSETNDFLKKLKTASLKEIGSLPAGQLMYTASNFNAAASKTISALMQMSTADDENEDVKEIIKKRLKEMAENGRVVEISAYQDLRGGLEVSEYQDGAKAVESQLNLYKALMKSSSSIGELPLKEKPEIKENTETVGGFKLSSVKLAFDFDKAVEKLPEEGREAAKAAMIKLAGESTTIWFGNSGNKVIKVTAKDFKTAKSAIEDYLAGGKPLDKDEAFQTTRKQLPADATILVLGDTARVMELGMEMVKDQAANIPGFPGGGCTAGLDGAQRQASLLRRGHGVQEGVFHFRLVHPGDGRAATPQDVRPAHRRRQLIPKLRGPVPSGPALFNFLGALPCRCVFSWPEVVSLAACSCWRAATNLCSISRMKLLFRLVSLNR